MARKIVYWSFYVGAIVAMAAVLYLFDNLEEIEDRLAWLEAENERLVIMVPHIPGMHVDRAEP